MRRYDNELSKNLNSPNTSYKTLSYLTYHATIKSTLVNLFYLVHCEFCYVTVSFIFWEDKRRAIN